MIAELIWNNTNENFSDNLTTNEKITFYFLIGFYIIVTIIVAYYKPINLFKIIRFKEPKNSKTINKVFSLILAIFFSIVFWIVKVLEVLFFNNKNFFSNIGSKIKTKTKKTKPKRKRSLKKRITTREKVELYNNPRDLIIR